MLRHTLSGTKRQKDHAIAGPVYKDLSQKLLLIELGNVFQIVFEHDPICSNGGGIPRPRFQSITAGYAGSNRTDAFISAKAAFEGSSRSFQREQRCRAAPGLCA